MIADRFAQRFDAAIGLITGHDAIITQVGGLELLLLVVGDEPSLAGRARGILASHLASCRAMSSHSPFLVSELEKALAQLPEDSP
ncbi:hypothetical protein [Amycolatopsis sp. NPDC004079]|uniref:hypothetical protein n=1 Tax=Amycolatopsis sp. NPDC004079 TaxID=3154549 RepID=UPI0033B6EB49